MDCVLIDYSVGIFSLDINFSYKCHNLLVFNMYYKYMFKVTLNLIFNPNL